MSMQQICRRQPLACLVLACAFGPALAQAPAKSKLPSGDPCTVVPLAEVQKAFPGAKAGVRNLEHEKLIAWTQCAYRDAKGAVVFAVEEGHGSTSALEEAQGEASGFLDPLSDAAKRAVRYETLTAIGLGKEAVAFVEVGDAKRGILGDGALLVMHKGQRTVTLASPVLAKRDRAAALKVFEELGRIAAKRLE